MTGEIIKLIEYITGNPVFQGAFIAYMIFGAIVVAMVVAIFVIALSRIIGKR